MKTRSFSIYLLKPNFDATNALSGNHVLIPGAKANQLPPGATLYLLNGVPKEPWWKFYFGIEQKLNQVGKGALVFLPSEKRCFALCFGHVAHFLKDESYEYDFGLRVTLNSVDPDKLKSTDTLQPGRSRRQRTQVPVDSDLTYFDFDRDSSILKGLTGKVKAKHSALFKHATGASNLRVSSSLEPSELVSLGKSMLELYASDEFETTFPDIQSVTPVRDPVQIKELDALLLEAIKSKDDGLSLSIPDIVNYADHMYGSFRGAGPSLQYEDIFMDRYYEYLEDNKVDLASLTIDDVKEHKLLLTDDNGTPYGAQHSVLKCMIFDATVTGKGTFHYTERNWYKVDPTYVATLQTDLDPLCRTLTLPPYHHLTEGAYNKAAASNSIVCLDLTSISPPGQRGVEPCDLYEVQGDLATLHHIKVSTLSSQLSHLFNQGTNAVELLKEDDKALERLKKLLEKNAVTSELPKILKPLADPKYHVCFGIVTHKKPEKKTLNLPLFSRISLRRCMRSLKVMSVKGTFGFVVDQSPKKAGVKKTRKKKAKP